MHLLFQVLNDSVGFAGPLLLNKLIQFLQQGLQAFDNTLFTFLCLLLREKCLGVLLLGDSFYASQPTLFFQFGTF